MQDFVSSEISKVLVFIVCLNSHFPCHGSVEILIGIAEHHNIRKLVERDEGSMSENVSIAHVLNAIKDMVGSARALYILKE